MKCELCGRTDTAELVRDGEHIVCIDCEDEVVDSLMICPDYDGCVADGCSGECEEEPGPAQIEAAVRRELRSRALAAAPQGQLL